MSRAAQDASLRRGIAAAGTFLWRAGTGGRLRFGGRAELFGDHEAHWSVPGRTGRLHAPGSGRASTKSTCGSTDSTSRSASRRKALLSGRRGCSAWMASRSWSAWPTATGVDRQLGRPVARPTFPGACESQCWPWATARPGSGRRCEMGGPHPDAAVLVHKVANVLAALPASQRPSARRMLAEIRDAEGPGMSARLRPRVGAKWRKVASNRHLREAAMRSNQAPQELSPGYGVVSTTRRRDRRRAGPDRAPPAGCARAREPLSARAVAKDRAGPRTPRSRPEPSTHRATTDGAHPTTSGQPQHPVTDHARPTIGASRWV